MSIRVVAVPVTLLWSQFKVVDSLPGVEDAHTQVNFALPNSPFRSVGGQYMFADNVTITVSPMLRVLKTANQTADLLAHEQGHYNIGILVGRAMARELETLSSPNPRSLTASLTAAFDKHRLKLMPVVQEAYDGATGASRNTSEQTRWNGLIATALAASAVDKLELNPL
jgi:hypothetical protein